MTSIVTICINDRFDSLDPNGQSPTKSKKETSVGNTILTTVQGTKSWMMKWTLLDHYIPRVSFIY